MGSKKIPGDFDCYANALPDEPMFIVLARDPSAPRLVRAWAEGREQEIERRERPRSDYAMVVEARDCAINMEAWRRMNDGKWRIPPTDPVICREGRDAVEAALRDLLVAVTFAAPPIHMGPTDGGPNLCYEARIPVEFVTNAEAALKANAETVVEVGEEK